LIARARGVVVLRQIRSLDAPLPLLSVITFISQLGIGAMVPLMPLYEDGVDPKTIDLEAEFSACLRHYRPLPCRGSFT
jgi:hypothetical protein